MRAVCFRCLNACGIARVSHRFDQAEATKESATEELEELWRSWESDDWPFPPKGHDAMVARLA